MTKRRITAEDIFNIQLVGNVARHPDKPKAVVAVTRMDKEDNSYRTHLWLVPTDGGEPSLYTNGSKSESAPAWSPDGRWLAFLSNRNEDKNQLYVMPEAGGEAVQVTFLPDGVGTFRWSPDSRRVAFTANVQEWARDEKPEKPDAEKTPREKFTKDAMHVKRSYYRLDGAGYFGEKRTHLFVADLTQILSYQSHRREPDALFDKSLVPTVRFTDGPYDVNAFTWSPDGRSIVISTHFEQDREPFRACLYRFDVPGSLSADLPPVQPDAMTCLTQDLYAAYDPEFSPDGRFIAFEGHNREHGNSTLSTLHLLDCLSGEIRKLAPEEDLVFGNHSITDTRASVSARLWWSSTSDAVYSVVSHRGTVQLVRVDVATGAIHWLTEGNHCVLSVGVDRADKEAVLTIGTPLDPANVYAIPLDGQGGLRKLTEFNEAWLNEVELAAPERFTFTSDGLQLDGWTMLPSGDAPAGGFPAVLEVHGGPAAMYSDSFFLEFQLLAASGMAVIFSNPRGSTGYGQAFCSAIEGPEGLEWGDLDFKDVEACMDAALAKYPLDPQRLAIAGGSYGGFMAAWAIGHTKRYRAAVVMRAVINWYSMTGSSDFGFISPKEEFGGKAPWEDPDRYLRISPITYVGNIEASTLIIHSELDFRCPIEQGEQLYTALRIRGVPVEFLRFPGESHGLSRTGKPWNRVVRLEKIAEFLTRELAVAQGAPAPQA
ncbi:MAG: S9 family peptidase [Alicyclobacillus sp.]|nr:S9 family peptidase [Alicyclobacillus sp.]